MDKMILFIYTNYSTFVRADYEILSEKYKVTRYRYKPVKGFTKTAFQFIRQFIFLLFNMWKFKAVYIWFADYHSFLPILFSRLFVKKSIIVIGGYDVANIPDLKYGSLSRPVRKLMTLYSFRNATLCIPVVETLERRLKEISPKAKTQTIYTGYSFTTSKTEKVPAERDKIVLTVSITESNQRYYIKGLDRFKELAENLPDFNFIVVGVSEDKKDLFSPKPKNLFLYPSLDQKNLYDFYSKASFYAQLSRSEGLPNALCEAMLYGCIPIGVNVGGIPTAIGNTGLILNEWDTISAIAYIQTVHNKKDRDNLKTRIENKFDIKFRKGKLLNLMTELIH